MKPITLQWKKLPGRKIIAETPALSYEINPDHVYGYCVYSNQGISSTRNFSAPLVADGLQTIEAAMDAAQTHFDAAIMACLE